MIQDLFRLRKKSSIGQGAFQRGKLYKTTVYDMETITRMQLGRFLGRRIFSCFSITLLGRDKSDIFFRAQFLVARK